MQDAAPSVNLVIAWMAAVKKMLTARPSKAADRGHGQGSVAPAVSSLVQALLSCMSHLPADCATLVLESLAEMASSGTSVRLSHASDEFGHTAVSHMLCILRHSVLMTHYVITVACPVEAVQHADCTHCYSVSSCMASSKYLIC